MSTALVLRAISLAARAHDGQLRKDGCTPYVAHPLRVVTILATVFGVQNAEVLAAGALHDVIEDTLVDRDDLVEQFGEVVAGYVATLSKDKRLPEQLREQAYLEALVQAPVEVKLCKLADTYDNLLDSDMDSDSVGQSDQFRSKKLRRAKELLERFEPGFATQWQHALDEVAQLVSSAEDIDSH